MYYLIVTIIMKSLTRRPSVFSLDIAHSDEYLTTGFDIVRSALIKRDRYSPDLIHRGCNGERSPTILQRGIERQENETYCMTEEDIHRAGTDGGPDVFSYAPYRTKPAIVVYDPVFFQKSSLPYAYELIDLSGVRINRRSHHAQKFPCCLTPCR